MSYFAAAYTIHFDDTMAYGSHHFLTAFKFQCAARESLLYGDHIFDKTGVRQALDSVHLLTADAYSRNLSPAVLGDRVAILITLEEWGRVSARFCYRVLGQQGQPICAGFQTMICSDATTGQPIPLPEPLRKAFDAIREITEVDAAESFRNRVLAGGESTEQLFADSVRETARQYLSVRYPHPQIVPSVRRGSPADHGEVADSTVHSSDRTGAADPLSDDANSKEVWVFPGQGAFNARLLCDRITTCTRMHPALRKELDDCVDIAQQLIGGDAAAIASESVDRCVQAVRATPGLSQVAIHLQSMLGALLRRPTQPAVLMGHSFGEIAALSVAGCFDLPSSIRVVCERVRAVAEFGRPDGGLLVAATDRATVAEEISVLGLLDVVVAGRNHERQTVVSGLRSQLDQLKAKLLTRDVAAIDVVSPTCFHHPLLRGAAAAWLRRLREIPIQRPNGTVYSPIGRRLISADDDIAAILSSQFVRPFDLQGSIDDLMSVGFARFVDCGSAGSLGRLLESAGTPAMQVVSMVETPESPVAEPQVAQPVARVSAATERNEVNPQTNTQSPEEAGSTRRAPIAIVGQGCLLPGGATSPAELHASVMQGRLGIVDQRELDPDWERDFHSTTPVPDRSTSPLAGCVNDGDILAPIGVDADVFHAFSRAQKLLCCALAPCVAELRDADRVLCLVGATADGFQDQDRFAALRYAGIDVNDARIAERMGSTSSAFQDSYSAVQCVFDRVVRPGLDVRLVDAACASSLYSVALGMLALENSEADVVLAGGVYCPGAGNNCLFSQFGGLTSKGCRPFDAHADGVVFSEGAAFVVLRRFADAEQMGQRVLAVVRGAGLSSDGRSSSANVPQTAGQLIALRRCYSSYGISPESITAIEGHGTSTPVGDATELNTLFKFFSDYAQSPIRVHSIKGLLGHTGWAAGAASVIAACESLRTGLFPAQAFHCDPSDALVKASHVLSVPTQPVQLPSKGCRIAIDGFGFGGANAHLVVESVGYSEETSDGVSRGSAAVRQSIDEELVVVQWHRLIPTDRGTSTDGSCCMRFNRQDIPHPAGVILLPDLADDMDVTQSLALSIVGETLSKIAGFDDELRGQTSIVLALGGKTERAVEATLRVLTSRLTRDLAGLPAAEAIERTAREARPSGPYTLQCMMPNVSAGRAALLFNLNGPNFVVDAGENSLEAAFSSAGLLLRGGDKSGTKLVVVAAINANRWPVPMTDAAKIVNEYAAALAVTTRYYADELGLNVLCPLKSVYGSQNGSDDRSPAHDSLKTTEEKLHSLVESLDNTNRQPARTSAVEDKGEFPIHTPVWIEAAPPPRVPDKQFCASERWLIIAMAHDEMITELLATLPAFCQHYLVALVGPTAKRIAGRLAMPNVLALDVRDERSAAAALSTIVEFTPEVVVALDKVRSWDFADVLKSVVRNDVCEALFLAIKTFVARIGQCKTEIWGLFPGAWRGVIYPGTGGISGLIKSAKREIPAGSMGVLSHRSESLRDALQALQCERQVSGNVEQEIVIDGAKRLVRRLRVVGKERSAGIRMPCVPLDVNSVVVASGGARGVTAILVEALLRDFGCTVVALGRSQFEKGPGDLDSTDVEREFYDKFIAENPRSTPVDMKKSFESARARWEASRTIDNLARVGGRIRYMTVDVTNGEEVDTAVARIVAEFGRIDLVLHGAGVQWSKKLEDRSLSEFRRTFDVKIAGLFHLVESCRKRFGKTVPAHLLTSAYSIFGNDGQHDYGAANETLDRLCGMTRVVPDVRWSSIAWSAWNGVGMTRGSEYRTLAKKRNLALIGDSAGGRVFREVMSGNTDSEINVPISAAERTRYRIRTIPPTNVTAPCRTSESIVDLSDAEYLAYHTARGVPTLPGAWIIDHMVRAALSLADHPVRYVTLEDIRFHRFVRPVTQYDPNFRVIVDAAPSGSCAWLIGDVMNPSGIALSSDEVFAQTALSSTDKSSLPRPVLRDFPPTANGSIRSVKDPYCGENQLVQLSGPFDCLRNIEIGVQGRRAVFDPNLSQNWDGVTPALLLDASLRVAGMHVVPDALHVPTKIDRGVIPVGITTDSMASSGWQIRTSAPVLDGNNIRCDRVEVTDNLGNLKLFVEGATVTRLQ